MKLLNEMVENWEIKELVSEMDTVINDYKNLVSYTNLYESTILDTLPDDLIQKVAEIDRRMEIIEKARRMVDKLEQSGWDKKKVQWHKSRLYDNRERIRKSMYTAKKKMAQLEKQVQDMISDIKPEDESRV